MLPTNQTIAVAGSPSKVSCRATRRDLPDAMLLCRAVLRERGKGGSWEDCVGVIGRLKR